MGSLTPALHDLVDVLGKLLQRRALLVGVLIKIIRAAHAWNGVADDGEFWRNRDKMR